ncbi:MAG TPA: hypothetical protein PK410_05690, partial [Paludibacteraceae bacterium]|nr:hypothetical protein [Paludibacteraceae bacterium]
MIKKIGRFFSLVFFLLLLSEPQQAQTVLNTSFENSEGYVLGNINNQNKWKVTSGNGLVTNDVNYVKTDAQALRLYSERTSLQTEYIAYDSNMLALSGDVYIDFWISIKSLPTANFSITGYDLGT